ncbi:hypothetical protein GWN26_09920 [Candidatus Saccharibacteria bacterium]|nr:hypothetical protein [Calditrichia bacterium]NIV99425.1 hypothetical protein [Candidatus Saccharibacteria bacterium]NIW79725.1 hypothetical protein [Calditrichia bacterium]
MRFLCALIGVSTAVAFILVDEKPFKVGLIVLSCLSLLLALLIQLRREKQNG